MMREKQFTLVGLRRTAGTLLAFLRDHVFGISISIVFEASCEIGSSEGSCPLIAFRFGGEPDVWAFTRERHDYGEAEKRLGIERLKCGDKLIIGELEREVVFYGWLMLGKMDLDVNAEVPLSHNAAYSYKIYAVPDVRGRGICGAYYQHLKNLLHQQGFERLVCRISPGNEASIRAHAHAGFRACGLLCKVGVPWHSLFFADPALRTWLPTIAPSQYFTRRGFLLRHAALNQVETRA